MVGFQIRRLQKVKAQPVEFSIEFFHYIEKKNNTVRYKSYKDAKLRTNKCFCLIQDMIKVHCMLFYLFDIL